MGGGGQHADEHQVIPPPRPFRHRRRTPSVPADSGLDRPPSVTCPSLGHQPCALNIRTAQHLCTLVHPPCNNREEGIPAASAPCDPIFAFGKYIVSTTDDGRVCFYSLVHQHDPPCRPVAVVEVDAHSTLTGIVAVREGVSLVRYRSTINKERLLIPPDFLGHLLAISSEGDVHILECTHAGKAKKLFSWNTGACNASYVTVRPDRTGQWRICLGYESGVLEEWQVFIPVRETKKTAVSDAISAKTEDKTETETSSAKERWMPLMRRVFPQLMYRGFFDLPIRSVSSLGCEVENQPTSESNITLNKDHSEAQTIPLDRKGGDYTDTETKEAPADEEREKVAKAENQEDVGAKEPSQQSEENEADAAVNDVRDYLSVCLVMNPRIADESLGRPSSSSQIEVVRVSTLERDWNTLLEQEQDHANTKDMALPLEQYCVWPHMGMDIMDTSSLPANDAEGQRRLSRRIRGLPSQGGDRLCKYILDVNVFTICIHISHNMLVSSSCGRFIRRSFSILCCRPFGWHSCSDACHN